MRISVFSVRSLRWSAAVLVLLLGACATVELPERHLQSREPAVQDCAQWFVAKDAAIDAAGVRDHEAWPVPGFPYLRSTRFLASFAAETAGDAQRTRDWLGHLRDADLKARAAEFRNLDADTAAAEKHRARAGQCGEILMRADLADAQAMATLRARVQVPDAYKDWQRVMGFYALSRIPFAGGVAQWHAEAREMFRRAREGAPAAHPLERYGPPAASGYTRAEVSALLARTARDPLGMPQLTADEQARLLQTYAPVFEVETTGDYDRPGILRWGNEEHPLVDRSHPAVYHRLAHVRYQGRTLLQLVYTIWFSERPADHAFDMLAGKLDGLVWRVTLGPDGSPLLYDTMHPCGCFHMFLPTPAAKLKPPPDPGDEWAFVPAEMPAAGEGERIRLRLLTRSHYLVDATADRTGQSATPYRMLAESELRSLPLPAGGFRGIYVEDGLVPDTDRPERMLFWPMGIPSAGAMRQWGNHATAFLGRRHFDDADLIEQRFELKLP